MRKSFGFFFSAACFSTLGAFPSYALNAEDICAQLQADYGVQPEICGAPTPTVAPETAVASQSVSAEISESHVFFTAGGTKLDNAAQVQLAALVVVLETAPMRTACLRLVGHSDTSGSAKINEELALKRAEVVSTSLKAGLADPSRVRELISAGETRPLEGLPTTDPLNRRVEIQAKTCP